jgi:type II secretory pathway predicted ATPase ExeA|tara:strand:- start:836 stop:1660 length:825 start_codon:yes stop_codon:yes gene_type:complete
MANPTETVKNVFGLSKMPFGKTLAVRELFASASFEEACARLEIGLENADVALLTGGVGTGKSNVLRFFISNLDVNVYQPIYLAANAVKIGELAKRILEVLHMQIPYQGTTAFRRLQQHIIHSNKEKGIRPLLVIDEIQELPIPTLVALKNLLNYEIDSQTLLSLILCGQKSLVEKFTHVSLESLKRRIGISYCLQELTLEETSKYIAHRMKLCGVDQNIFTDETKAGIFQHSKGVMAKINAVCFDALIYAAVHSKDLIEPSILEVVLHNQDRLL